MAPTPRGSDHAMLHEEDLILMYCIVNKIKVNWINIMKEHMLKSRRLYDYKFPYVILISKLIDYFEVDVNNERNETIKVFSEIDCSTLRKMGFQKYDAWIHKPSVVPNVEYAESSHAAEENPVVVGNAEAEEVDAKEAPEMNVLNKMF